MSSPTAAALAEKREALEAQLATITAVPADLGGISFGKRVGEGTSLAVERLSQIAAHDRLQHTLAEVQRAQEKLAEGTYGQCDRCEGPVGDARLEAMPWATLCIACAGEQRR
jgi:DnaK suppressor protein